MSAIKFVDANGTFRLDDPEKYSGLYFPLAGESGLKSCVTPTLGGDAKLDQNHFLLEPVSIENLHNNKNTRNFWLRVKGHGVWSACGSSALQEAQRFTPQQDECVLEAGFMWQKLTRTSREFGLEAEITSFVTVDGKVEVHLVRVKNISSEVVKFTPTAVIPIYGRSADNLRDHRHVTSLLHRIRTTEQGVEVKPVLSFDERGHQKNDVTYFAAAFTGEGKAPAAFYPTVEEFIGEGGSFSNPEAVRASKPGRKAGEYIEGKEAVGAMLFAAKTLQPDETATYIMAGGIAQKGENISALTAVCCTETLAEAALSEVKRHWLSKLNISFSTGDAAQDGYLKWIEFQPTLRRIYGCSFLPYHDYGRGGRGWRDLWQDCLALLLMQPEDVRGMLLDNFGGVRIDGTNATIIGAGQGEFIADRNGITRVWMDHAFWPFLTTKLYIDQTGDVDILLEKAPYFKDEQSERGTAHDGLWAPQQGCRQRTAAGQEYFGTVLEHLLVQNLCAFYDVGTHNEMLLHGADWNDALDMAAQNGESVAFTCAYVGNLRSLAGCLRRMERTGHKGVTLAKELEHLLGGSSELFESAACKQELLRQYLNDCRHTLSGEAVQISTLQLAESLEQKADWLARYIRRTEWLQDGDIGWFNGYYDNSGRPVERTGENARMMLTGQVFAIMSGTATDEQIKCICRAADHYLYDEAAGGYRLNTNFHEEKFDLGRMFGFAYGEKENGAVFCHMAVMYANALYTRGFAAEGHKVLHALLAAAMNFGRSVLYPGLPEYFDNCGRGLYAYLTGAASWYLLTEVQCAFGVRGDFGDLVLHPALSAGQFGPDGTAAVTFGFAGRQFELIVQNPQCLPAAQAALRSAEMDSAPLDIQADGSVRMPKALLQTLAANKCHTIQLILG